MPAAANKSKIPNQNDLFEIFKVQVTTIAAVNAVIVKAKVNKNVTDNIRQAANVLMDSTAAIYAAIEKSAKFNTKNAEATMNAVIATTKAISAITGSIDQILAIKNSRIRSARRGVGKLAKFLFGKDKKGLLGKQMGLFTLMETAGDEKYAKVISGGTKNLKSISESIRTLNGTLVIIGVSLIPLTLALLSVWVISKIVNVVVGMFRYVSKYDKSISKGAKTLNTIAKAVMLIGAAALMMALTGLLIITAWPAMLASMAFVVLLVGMFVVIGLAAKFINKGGKELLYIAAVVAILALTATLMALTGQFITVNWDAFLITLAFIGGLILAFVLISLAAKFINKGGKELLFIALTVGILAIVVAALVWVGGLIETNQEAIESVFLMMLGLTALFIGVGFAGKLIEKSKLSFLMIMIYTVILGAVTYIFVDCALKLNEIGGREQFDHIMIIMGAMVLGIAGIAIGLGALTLTGFGAAALWAGIGAMGAIVGMILLLGVSMKTMVSAIRMANEIDGDKDEILEKMSIPIEVAVGLIGNILAVPPFILPIVAGRMLMLTSMVGNIGKMADTLKQVASLNMPVEWDKDGKPIKFVAMQQKDFIEASTNAATIIQFFAAVFDDKKYKLPNGVVVGGAMNGIKNISFGAAWKVRRLRKIVKHIGSMAETLQHIASLNIPTEWDDKGKPIKFQQMTSKDFLDASLNAAGILMFFAALFKDNPTTLKVLGSTVRISPLNTKNLENISWSTRRKIKRLKKIVGYVGEMADTIQKVSTLTVPNEIDPETGKIKTWRRMVADDFTAASTNVATIMTTLVGAISSEDLATQLDNMSRHAAKNFGRVMEGMGGITGIVELVKMLSGGEVVTEYKTDENPNSPTYGQRIPAKYQSINEFIKDPRITENVKALFDVVIKSFAPYNHGDLEDQLHDAEDEIETIQTVVTGASESVTVIMSMYKEHLVDVDPEAFKSKYSAATSVMTDMVRMFGGNKVNVKGANVINKNIHDVNNLLVQVDKVNIDKLKTVDSLMKHISDLSKSIHGNFEGLAKVISEDLLEALNKLTGALDGTNDSIRGTAKASTPGDVIATPSGSAGVNKGKEKQQPQRNNQPQVSPADIAAIKKTLSDIATKLTSVINGNNAVNVQERI